jgi:hypothetical protein
METNPTGTQFTCFTGTKLQILTVVSARTTTVYNNYNPQWNETLRFFVKDGGKEALERQVRL